MKSTENDILAAAARLFSEHGYKATSTTDIAHAAGCNQALVHYYFRTKENLFQKVFLAEMDTLLERLREPLTAEGDFFSRLRSVVDTYFDIINEHPDAPNFILNELVFNPERRAIMKDTFFNHRLREDFYSLYCASVEEAVGQGIIRPIDPIDLYLDIVSLVVFSHVATPLFCDFLDFSEQERTRFLTRRREEIYTLLVDGLRSGRADGGE